MQIIYARAFILSLYEIRFLFSEQENIGWNFLSQRYPYNNAGHSTALSVEVLQVRAANCNSVDRYWKIQHK